MTDGPRFAHDCDRCTFLGRWEDFDLYHCTQTAGRPTVIARFGNDGPDYFSGLAIAKAVHVVFERGRDGRFQLHPEPVASGLAVALERARERGLPVDDGLSLRLRHQVVALSDVTETAVTITGRCTITGQQVVIRDVPLAGLAAWNAGDGEYIQTSLAALSASEREFLLTGIGPDAQAEHLRDPESQGGCS